MKKTVIVFVLIIFIGMSCNKKEDKKNLSSVKQENIDNIIKKLNDIYDEDVKERIEKGVNQAAAFWTEEDGTNEDFEVFCMESFINKEGALDTLFMKLSHNFEILWGNYNQITVSLTEPLHMNVGEIDKVDILFGAYEVSSHLEEDLYNNKIAFIVLLNFPHYSLEEKTKLGNNWIRKQWAYARMGDVFTSRIPAELLQNYNISSTNSDTYISEYNIIMHNLLDKEENRLFPEDLNLITHWGLRDELKSNYNTENGLAKQKLIYEVMKDIINQDIPEKVINNDKYLWNPVTDRLFENENEIKFKPEPNTRYQHLLNNFKSLKAMDAYNPYYTDYIQQRFEGRMEITQQEVEAIFIELLSSEQVKIIAEIIKENLGRELEPYDIWYNGFVSQNNISEEELDKITKEKYPDEAAFSSELANFLVQLGFDNEKAKFIQSKITVDASRGAGHAWGAEMISDNARLRTRFGEDGMNYKAYNIATHEFGHNVEQTITLHDIDYYMLHGVPNTAFTEAIAFFFQKRDLELLNIKNENSIKNHMLTLEVFWSAYEIMGVSLVDMNVWKWMYEHPDANKEELKIAVIDIAEDIWNKYYASVFGKKDEPILAIYSHMIDNPLYLSAYPIGHLIHFQIEQYIKDKNIAEELQRMLICGRTLPQYWINNAVRKELSNKALLTAVDEAIIAIKESNANEK